MIISLLTDFGVRDYFVGAMKGVILSIDPAARIVDITHEIPAQDISAASFTLRACHREFPPETIFVAVVDPGVGSDRRAILVRTGEHFFIAPDNGLLSFIFNGGEPFTVFEIAEERFFRHPVSRTFHGRDVFSPAAAHLSAGVEPGEFGPEIGDFVRHHQSAPRRTPDGRIEAEIIHIDRFGNLITNLTRNDLAGTFSLEIGGRSVEKLSDYFAQAVPGEVFMIWGSAGFLEVAAFRDSARNLLAAEVGDRILVNLG
ncbi:MAG: SAM-dependent chlorinase/fluorinase [Pyrinomonadaceae bacterium]